MGNGYFSLAQWQELELQALIYKHMLAGAPVPHELLYLIKKSLSNSSPYYNMSQQYHHYQQASKLHIIPFFPYSNCLLQSLSNIYRQYKQILHYQVIFICSRHVVGSVSYFQYFKEHFVCISFE